MSVNGNTGGEHGIEHEQVDVITFTYNRATCQVTIGGSAMPVSLAQMIVGEGLRLLEEQRKIAAVAQLKQHLEDQQRTAAILASIKGKG